MIKIGSIVRKENDIYWRGKVLDILENKVYCVNVGEWIQKNIDIADFSEITNVCDWIVIYDSIYQFVKKGEIYGFWMENTDLFTPLSMSKYEIDDNSRIVPMLDYEFISLHPVDSPLYNKIVLEGLARNTRVYVNVRGRRYPIMALNVDKDLVQIIEP